MIKLENVSSSIFKKYQDERLSYVDDLNKGSILLLQNPTNYSTARLSSVKYETIADLKRNLAPNEDGNIEVWCRKFGNYYGLKLIDAINMYTEQVEKQAQLTQNREINLFEYQKEQKVEFIYKRYKDVIAYLLYAAKEELVWGKLSDAQRKLYLSSIINDKQTDNMIKGRVVDYISNYTTLPELDRLYRGDYKVLNKFIRK